jgi:hypothetical protein
MARKIRKALSKTGRKGSFPMLVQTSTMRKLTNPTVTGAGNRIVKGCSSGSQRRNMVIPSQTHAL